jgi:adenine phosphoribosyltransferase
VTDLASRIRDRIRDVPDFPQPGIVFKDLTPVLAEPDLLGQAVRHMADPFRDAGIDRIAAIESRGFILGAPLAIELGIGFSPIRKPGKLPWRTIRVDYQLEYGTDALEAHTDAIEAGSRVLLVDDLLATGGTAAGAADLVRRLGGIVVGATFLVELGSLGGRHRLGAIPTLAVVRFDV